ETLRTLFGGLAPGSAGTTTPAATWYGRAWQWAERTFRGLTLGLALAVVAILLLLTAYFQSLRLALVAVASVPAVLAGVVAALLLTGTTLNLQSFMGSIMAVGVAVANAILLVTFADRARRAGATSAAAAVAGAAGVAGPGRPRQPALRGRPMKPGFWLRSRVSERPRNPASKAEAGLRGAQSVRSG